MIMKVHKIVIKDHKKVIKFHKMVIKGHKMVIKGHKMVIKDHKMVIKVTKWKKGSHFPPPPNKFQFQINQFRFVLMIILIIHKQRS